MAVGRLRQARASLRFLERISVAPARGPPQRVRGRKPQCHRVPGCPDAYAVNPYLLTSGVQGAEPLVDFAGLFWPQPWEHALNRPVTNSAHLHSHGKKRTDMPDVQRVRQKKRLSGCDKPASDAACRKSRRGGTCLPTRGRASLSTRRASFWPGPPSCAVRTVFPHARIAMGVGSKEVRTCSVS